jgi:ketosteroid isomerase-like protein
MYKAIVRALVRKGLRELNAGNPDFILGLAAPDVELAFPGDNSWATMFRPAVKGCERHVTHVGIDECRAFAERFVADGIQFGEPEDILVNGPPWRTRIAVVFPDRANDGDGNEVYANRAVLYAIARWGKITRQEDFEDTVKVEAFDRWLDAHGVAPADAAAHDAPDESSRTHANPPSR